MKRSLSFVRRASRYRRENAPPPVVRDLAGWRTRLRGRYLAMTLAGAAVPSAVWAVETVHTVSPWYGPAAAAAGAAVAVLGRRWADGDAACVDAERAAECAPVAAEAQRLRGQVAAVHEWMSWYSTTLSQVRHDLKAALGQPAPDPGQLLLPTAADVFTDFDHALATVLEEAVEAVGLARAQGAAQGEKDLIGSIAPRLHALNAKALTELEALENELDGREMRMAYRVDHFSTRVRHYIESLMVLGGRAFASSREPVLLSTVLRSAVAETEDFQRTTSTWPREELWLVGYAGPGITHMLAALINNAVHFSDNDVRVTAQWQGTDLLIAVEDRGLSMTEEALADANALLAAPSLDAERERLHRGLIGLPVIARLAQAYGIRVELRANPAPESGITASVEVPRKLITTGAEVPPALRRARRRPVVRPAAPAAPVPNAEAAAREHPALPHRAPVPAPAAGPTSEAPGDRPSLPSRSRSRSRPVPETIDDARGRQPAPAPGPTPLLAQSFLSGSRSAPEPGRLDEPPPAWPGPDSPPFFTAFRP
ncbi:ATP-binding protein [Streptomyces jumonjinensis]|uniref:ATP-binding protein n=1 Tax=Streptomyces jumonjinensis TaxID=1945 RepID=UPI0037B44A77